MSNPNGVILHEFRNERGDTLIIFNDHIELDIQPVGFFNNWPNPYRAHTKGLKKYMPFNDIHIDYKAPGFFLPFIIQNWGKLTFNNEGRSYGFRPTCIFFKNDGNVNNKEYWSEVPNLIMKAKVTYEKVSSKKTIVQGDQITKTEIKDSVLNRSNVGGKSSKAEELREVKSLLDEGLINENDYEKMKKEILNK